MSKHYGYLLIYDTGAMIFKTVPEALKFADYLRRKGHKLDRIQTNVNVHEGATPKIVHEFKNKKR